MRADENKARRPWFTCNNNNKFLVTHYGLFIEKKDVHRAGWRWPKSWLNWCVCLNKFHSFFMENGDDLFINLKTRISQLFLRKTIFTVFPVVISTLSPMSVYILFPPGFPPPNVYGVDVNSFVYADDVKFYVSAFFRMRDDCFFDWKVLAVLRRERDSKRTWGEFDSDIGKFCWKISEKKLKYLAKLSLSLIDILGTSWSFSHSMDSSQKCDFHSM